MKQDMFRKEALQKQSAPDNTDKLIILPRLPYWIGIAILLIIVVTVFHTFTHMIEYTYVEGDGLFLNNSSDSFQNSSSNLEVILFIKYTDGNKVLPGMEVRISPLTMDKDEYANIRGIVSNASTWPAKKEEVVHLLDNNNELANYFLSNINGPPYLVRVSLDRKTSDPDSYVFSSRIDEEFIVMPYTPCHGRIIIKQNTIKDLFFPNTS